VVRLTCRNYLAAADVEQIKRFQTDPFPIETDMNRDTGETFSIL